MEELEVWGVDAGELGRRGLGDPGRRSLWRTCGVEEHVRESSGTWMHERGGA